MCVVVVGPFLVQGCHQSGCLREVNVRSAANSARSSQSGLLGTTHVRYNHVEGIVDFPVSLHGRPCRHWSRCWLSILDKRRYRDSLVWDVDEAQRIP